jgi:pimeloyl-ACP methyl ester carboxylesterase
MKILFVRGFFTYLAPPESPYDTYANFLNFFLLKNHCKVTYFNYSSNDSIYTVFERFCKLLQNHSFDIIIAHSYGCTLTFNYFLKRPSALLNYQKIIFLMPLLYKRFDAVAVFSLPSIRNLSIPKFLVIPQYELNSNFQNCYSIEEFNTNIPLQQLAEGFTGFLPDSSVFIAFLNNHKDKITTIYALGDTLAYIPFWVRAQIDNIHYCKGKHEAFNESANSNSFFLLLKHVLF